MSRAQARIIPYLDKPSAKGEASGYCMVCAFNALFFL